MCIIQVQSCAYPHRDLIEAIYRAVQGTENIQLCKVAIAWKTIRCDEIVVKHPEIENLEADARTLYVHDLPNQLSVSINLDPDDEANATDLNRQGFVEGTMIGRTAPDTPHAACAWCSLMTNAIATSHLPTRKKMLEELACAEKMLEDNYYWHTIFQRIKEREAEMINLRHMMWQEAQIILEVDAVSSSEESFEFDEEDDNEFHGERSVEQGPVEEEFDDYGDVYDIFEEYAGAGEIQEDPYDSDESDGLSATWEDVYNPRVW